jgi:hypothetical protein
MSARENLLRKSCRAPADNHFIYVSHRQHSCGKKDLYQRFFTTHENVTLSAHTRLQQFLADQQGAVLKRAQGVLGGLESASSVFDQQQLKICWARVSAATSATLNVKTGWPVTGISPRVEFKIVLNRTFRIEPDHDFLIHGQFPLGELSGFRFTRKVFVPTAGYAAPPTIAKVVGKRGGKIMSAR